MAKTSATPPSVNTTQTTSSIQNIDILNFDLYIDAVGDGASRSRGIIAILMTATVVAGLGLFNSLRKEHNFFSSRIDVFHKAYEWVVFPDDENHKRIIFSRPYLYSNINYDTYLVKKDTFIENTYFKTGDTIKSRLNIFTWDEFRTCLDSLKIKRDTSINFIPSNLHLKFPDYLISPDAKLNYTRIDSTYNKTNKINLNFESKDIEIVLATVHRLNIVTRDEMDALLVHFDRAKIENSLLIRMPVLGVSFDVNWLALVSAVAFSMLLFLLYYSLSRERKNLFLVFRVARKRGVDRLDFYQMLSMRQVLNVPQSIDQHIFNENQERKDTKWELLVRKITNHIARYPLYSPALAWLMILIHDIRTLEVGRSTNSELTDASFSISLIAGAIMLFFTYLCWSEWSKIVEIWDSEASEIIKNHSQDRSPLVQLGNENRAIQAKNKGKISKI